MIRRSQTQRRARIVQNSLRAAESCDPATLERLDQLMAALAGGARLEQFCVSACTSLPLPAEIEQAAARLLPLYDPPVGQG